MAKSKKNIGDFQDALMSNTKVLNKPSAAKKTAATKKKLAPKTTAVKTKTPSANQLQLDSTTYKNFSALAKKHDVDINDLAKVALNMFGEFEKELL